MPNVRSTVYTLLHVTFDLVCTLDRAPFLSLQHATSPFHRVPSCLLPYHSLRLSTLLVVVMLGVQFLDGGIDRIIHRLAHVAEEKAQDARHRPEGRGDYVHDPEAVCKGLLQPSHARRDDGGSDARNAR